jgi:pentatricopeptide repeat protein
MKNCKDKKHLRYQMVIYAEKYGIKPSKYRRNALILAYTKSNDSLNAEKVLREMVKDGLRPDAITYTTVIDAYKRARDIPKCWELY